MRLIFLFIAIALSAAAAFFTYNIIAGKKPDGVVAEPQAPRAETKEVDIYVARDKINVGDVITRQSLDRKKVPDSTILDKFIRADDNKALPVEGLIARVPFEPGEPIMRNKVGNKNDPSFMAANLKKGMRAVTISADPISGLQGFAVPGDRVDVLITHELLKSQDKQAGTEDPNRITETLISDVRVLAVDDQASGVVDKEESARRKSINSITLEVTAKDAQRLRLGERYGQLALTLRSLEDRDDVTMANPTASGDLTRILPPSYFPVLYGFDEEYTPEMLEEVGLDPESVAMGAEGVNKDKILVVRGVAVEEMEITQP